MYVRAAPRDPPARKGLSPLPSSPLLADHHCRQSVRDWICADVDAFHAPVRRLISERRGPEVHVGHLQFVVRLAVRILPAFGLAPLLEPRFPTRDGHLPDDARHGRLPVLLAHKYCTRNDASGHRRRRRVHCERLILDPDGRVAGRNRQL